MKFCVCNLWILKWWIKDIYTSFWDHLLNYWKYTMAKLLWIEIYLNHLIRWYSLCNTFPSISKHLVCLKHVCRITALSGLSQTFHQLSRWRTTIKKADFIFKYFPPCFKDWSHVHSLHYTDDPQTPTSFNK